MCSNYYSEILTKSLQASQDFYLFLLGTDKIMGRGWIFMELPIRFSSQESLHKLENHYHSSQ